jgi:predicted transcriptional regulator
VAADPRQREHRRAFLLQQLAGAPQQRLTRGEANRKVPKAVARELGLDPTTAHRLREEMAGEGFLTINKEGAGVTYELTARGRDHLATLTPYPPPPAVAANLLPYMKAYVLLDLFLRKDRTASQGDLDHRLPQPVEKAAGKRRQGGPLAELGLTAGPVADHVRRTLAEQGSLREVRSSRTVSYVLTPEGVEYLTTLEQYPGIEFRLPAEQLNELVKAVREASFREPEERAVAATAAEEEREPAVS